MPSPLPNRAPSRQVVKVAEQQGSAPEVFTHFEKLLRFWRSVYREHSCERRFLEFSSGIPFETWEALVDTLKGDLVTASAS